MANFAGFSGWSNRDTTTMETLDFFLVMGATGSGKSSFINCVTNTTKMAVGRGLKSCTKDMHEALASINDRDCCFLDSPGFEDARQSDTDILKKICNWLELTYRNKIKVKGIIYLREITDAKMRGPSLKNIEMFQELCGTESLRNVIFVTTKWDLLKSAYEKEIGEEREQEYMKDYLGPMISLGAQTARHYNTTVSARKIVNEIFGKSTVTLQVQRELVDQKKPLEETAAGKVINAELLKCRAELFEEQQKNEERLKTEHEAAKILMGERHRTELKEREKEFEEQIKGIKADRTAEMDALASQLWAKYSKATRPQQSSVDGKALGEALGSLAIIGTGLYALHKGTKKSEAYRSGSTSKDYSGLFSSGSSSKAEPDSIEAISSRLDEFCKPSSFFNPFSSSSVKSSSELAGFNNSDSSVSFSELFSSAPSSKAGPDSIAAISNRLDEFCKPSSFFNPFSSSSVKSSSEPAGFNTSDSSVSFSQLFSSAPSSSSNFDDINTNADLIQDLLKPFHISSNNDFGDNFFGNNNSNSFFSNNNYESGSNDSQCAVQ